MTDKTEDLLIFTWLFNQQLNNLLFTLQFSCQFKQSFSQEYSHCLIYILLTDFISNLFQRFLNIFLNYFLAIKSSAVLDSNISIQIISNFKQKFQCNKFRGHYSHFLLPVSADRLDQWEVRLTDQSEDSILKIKVCKAAADAVLYESVPGNGISGQN